MKTPSEEKQSKIIKEYDKNLKTDEAYLSLLPDPQQTCSIEGSKVEIQQVGVSNFKMPLFYECKDQSPIALETSIIGTVSLDAQSKGINMSRIVRTLYEHEGKVFSLNKLEEVLKNYKEKLGSFEAKIIMKFSYPVKQKSLRSGLEGWQYYQVALEGKMNRNGEFEKIIHFDFVYSSACPCSYELSQHAIETRNQIAISHSQRSIARLSLKLNDFLWIEEIRDICVEALKTETQVMVKREDEQAFAELNGSNQKFVEDACRLLYSRLNEEKKIDDFKAICIHLESLHSHSAVGIIVKGVENGFTSDTDYDIFSSIEFKHIH
jgi:GTP cyclohydrolase I